MVTRHMFEQARENDAKGRFAANRTTYRRNLCGELFAFEENAAHDLRMESSDYTYIWQASDWPTRNHDLASLAGSLADVSRAQGLLIGRLADVGMTLRDQTSLSALTEDVIKTSAIEGEQLNADSVCSPILGVDIGSDAVLAKTCFWQRCATMSLNEL